MRSVGCVHGAEENMHVTWKIATWDWEDAGKSLDKHPVSLGKASFVQYCHLSAPPAAETCYISSWILHGSLNAVAPIYKGLLFVPGNMASATEEL